MVEVETGLNNVNRGIFFHPIVDHKRDPGGVQDTDDLLRHAGSDEALIGDDEGLFLGAVGQESRNFRNAATTDNKTGGGMEGKAVRIRHVTRSLKDGRSRNVVSIM